MWPAARLTPPRKAESKARNSLSGPVTLRPVWASKVRKVGKPAGAAATKMTGRPLLTPAATRTPPPKLLNGENEVIKEPLAPEKILTLESCEKVPTMMSE